MALNARSLNLAAGVGLIAFVLSAAAGEPVDYLVMTWLGQDLRVEEIGGHPGIFIGRIHRDDAKILGIKCHIEQPAGGRAWITVYSAKPKSDIDLQSDGIRRNIADCDANGPSDSDQEMGVFSGLADSDHFAPLEAGDIIGLIARGPGWRSGYASGVLQIKLGSNQR